MSSSISVYLEVAVDKRRGEVVVEILETLRDAERHAVARRRPRRAAAVASTHARKVRAKRAKLRELEHETQPEGDEQCV